MLKWAQLSTSSSLYIYPFFLSSKANCMEWPRIFPQPLAAELYSQFPHQQVFWQQHESPIFLEQPSSLNSLHNLTFYFFFSFFFFPLSLAIRYQIEGAEIGLLLCEEWGGCHTTIIWLRFFLLAFYVCISKEGNNFVL